MIITSLLDTDLYKFTMMQVVLHHFPAGQVSYQFKCRTPHIDFSPYLTEINTEVDALCQLRFQEHELAYLRSLRFISSDFVDFLGLFQLNRKNIRISCDGYKLNIDINGPWLHTILFEIPVLAIVNEVYFRHQNLKDLSIGRQRLQEKIALLKNAQIPDCRIADYGTRRRFSKAWHQEVLLTLRQTLGNQFVGTSNVMFAMQLGITPLGTMAHEYLQACQALGPRLRDSQVFAFEKWAQEYRGDLGIALSDVYGISAFLRDFDMYFCKLFDGARHDSGDPLLWGEKMIAHYKSNRVDPRTKMLVFSDGLTIPRTIELYLRFRDRIQLAFGVGTHLTNDVGMSSLQIVIKLVRCNDQPVAKLSDTPEKNDCDDTDYLDYLRKVFTEPIKI